MTALWPIESWDVRPTVSAKYPLNKICAHPECNEPVESAHHIFNQGKLKGGQWFVEIEFDSLEEKEPVLGEIRVLKNERGKLSAVIPHVIGFCGHGTVGHHGDAEDHRAWIKLEEGVFVWYQEITRAEVEAMGEVYEQYGQHNPLWRRVGPLNPQPCAGKGAKKRKKKNDAERRKRKNMTVKVPADKEDGAGLWDDTQEEIKERLIRMGLYDENDLIPAYEAWMAAARDWLNS